jgi:alpha-glucosidase (family GH31 glycosyl hydrolase)
MRDADAQAIKSHQTGIPMMRHLLLDFPDDPVAPYLDKQYLLGDSLLVAPVLHASRAAYYIPAGKWTDLWTGEVVEGPKHVVEEDCPIDRIPVFVRPGTVLLLGPEDVDVPDYAYGEVRLEARAYELQGETEVEVPSGRGPEIVGRVVLSAAGEVRDKGGMNVVNGDVTVALA